MTTILVLLGVTTAVSSAAPWTDHGWGRLAAKASKGSDLCRNIEGAQRTVPSGYTRDARGACHATPTPTPNSSSALPAPQLGFTRVFTDEFNGSALDTTKWSPYTGHLSSSDGCNEPDNLQVANGTLTMLFAYQGSGACGAGWYHGSMMVAGAYGGNNQSVTVRFRVLNNDPANTRAHRILPMRWPEAVNGGSTPPWYNGEADYCEGDSLTECTTYLHYKDSSSQVAQPQAFDATQWHTFRATQRAGNDVDIFVDDMAVPRWSYDGSTTTVPDVFRRTVLQQECSSSCPTNQAGWERIEVDYVTIDNQ